MLPGFFNDHSSLQGAVPVLTDAALKGAVLVIIAACGAYLLRNRSAASRHAVWTAAVVGHMAIPALVFVLPAYRLPVLPAAPWMAAESTASSAAPAVASDAKGNGIVTPRPAETPAPDRGSPVSTHDIAAAPTQSSDQARPGVPARGGTNTSKGNLPVLAAIWLAGALLVLLRLALGTWRVEQIARDSARVEDGVWLSLAQRLANRLGVTRPLTLLRGERLAVPVTWGIVYPAVLLPQDADTWSEERRRFVLVHEMAHVKRFDALTQLVAQISLAAFWFDPLVWLAAHQMRVEREHACDDYVLRDGTTPSLYAGELLEMVRSIGTPRHDRAAPAFAALAMARRSEFEGRMLAILDPRLDRQTLNKRGTLMTAIVVALLTIPLAALRPFQQPSSNVSTGSPTSTAGRSSAATVSQRSSRISPQSVRSCDSYATGSSSLGISTHIDIHNSGNSQILELLISTPSRCTEAAVLGKAVFSPDETHIEQLSPGGFARFRERTTAFDRAVSVTTAGDGSLSYSAMVDGRAAPFDAGMSAWLAHLLPDVLREAAFNVPARVARLRAHGGVPAVLQEISLIHTSAAKRAHYEELIKNGPTLSETDAEKIAQQVGRDLTSSGDLSAVLQMLPRSAVQSPGARQAIADALSRIQSSGDKAATLAILAPNADPGMLLLLAKAAEDLSSSGDKANFLITTAAEYLASGSESLRNAYFRVVSSVQSSGDMANVLISVMPYGHASPAIPLEVIHSSKALASSGDAANVLIQLITMRLLQPGDPRVALALVDRTLTMASSGDRANVLIMLAGSGALSNPQVKDAFTKAAMALPSEGDRANVLASAARH
jgi:beta-lactamase regulating signal transducer with metallopeptidase domain